MNIPSDKYVFNYKTISKITKKSIETLKPIVDSNGALSFCEPAGVKNNGLSEKFINAKHYLEEVLNKSKMNGPLREYAHLSLFEINKLNGIQEGIKVFENLSMKDIAYIFKNLESFLIQRGCSNRCSHCYVNAIPQQHLNKSSEYINRMGKEDFDYLINGIKELNKRLGFKFISPHRSIMALFYDSDCVEMELRGKNGKIYDFVDINEKFKQVLNKEDAGLFDTSGWYPGNKKLQERAEKIVDYLTKNKDRVHQTNISFNPFHSLYEKSLENAAVGNQEKAKKFLNFYTTRMANAIYTFTPLLENDKLNLLIRFKSNFKDHDEKAVKKLGEEVLNKLEKMYINDYKTSQKYIKSENQIKTNLKKLDAQIKEETAKYFNEITYTPRSEQFFDKKELLKENFDKFSMKNSNFLLIKATKIIDSNGKVYIEYDGQTFPTVFSLNFKNKNKKTIEPNYLIDKEIITRNDIFY